MGSIATLADVHSQNSSYLDPRSAVAGAPQGFLPSSSLLSPPSLALLLVVFPSYSLPLPTLMVLPLLFPVWCVALRVGPQPPKMSQSPPTTRRGLMCPLTLQGAGTGLVRFDPANSMLPPGPPGGRGAPLPVDPVVESVASQLQALDLPSSFMDPPEVEALRARLRKNWRTSASDRKNCRDSLQNKGSKLLKRNVCLSACKENWLSWWGQSRNSMKKFERYLLSRSRRIWMQAVGRPLDLIHAKVQKC